MKKHLCFILFFCFSCSVSFAHHVVGGEIYYAYVGPGSSPGTSIYAVTLRLFRNCNAGADAAQLPGSVTIGVFTNQYPYDVVKDTLINRTTFTSISKTIPYGYPLCISSYPVICYQVATYTENIQLTDTQWGYRVSFQTCCRLGSVNVADDALNSTTVPGATYECVIPGTTILPQGHNSSAVFKLKDTALVCAGSKFSLDFGATDPDPEDSLSYVFTAADDGGSIMDAGNYPPGNPIYQVVDYVSPYTAFSPLGTAVSLNPLTGLITGIAPGDPSPFVVCVLVNEWRKGILISSHRKDFILIVSSCNIPQATLSTSYINCGNYNFTFADQSRSGLITSYYWDFGVPGTAADTSDASSPTFVYPDTGTYNVTLIVNRGQQCTDTAISVAKVYPGFFPKFGVYGNCVNESYQFIDSTISKYGVPDYWRWTFDTNIQDPDGSSVQNPLYKFGDTGLKTIQLIVGSNKGCLDTISQVIDVLAKPALILPFRDTLICSTDTLQLLASSDVNGIGYQWGWLPNYNISNITIPNPFVFPQNTTTYIVSFNDNNGCANTDSVKVNVIDKVNIDIGADTTICKTDSIQLVDNTNALYFSWSPATGLNNANIQNPIASPSVNTTYTVTGAVGKCIASASKKITVVPYPLAKAFADTSICYGYVVQINGTMNGSHFTWSPTNSLLNPNSLTPIAGPQSTTTYFFSATDTLGCPKPTIDSVTVTVIPKVNAFAGDDTSIVANQPLQLNATGGTTYIWTPSTGMNNAGIANPIVTLGQSIDSIIYTVKAINAQGCFSTDSLKVIVFKTGPEIFVPSAFTPNGDGRNDILKPILVGMKQLDFFRVYNRLGNLVYATSAIGQGWDGTLNGIKQAAGTFVFAAEAIDYLGKKATAKGTVVLIR